MTLSQPPLHSEQNARITVEQMAAEVVRDLLDLVQAGEESAYQGLYAYCSGQRGVTEKAAALATLATAAHRQKDPFAQALLGELYQNGVVHKKNAKSKAKNWYRRAADQGHIGAAYTLSLMLVDEGGAARARGVQGLRILAQKIGFAPALYPLARTLRQEPNPDWGEVATFLDQASQCGSIDATRDLGFMLFAGHVVPRDPAKGNDLFIKAARAGDPDAQFMLGKIHASGEFYEPEYNTAARWLRQAAGAGHIAAMGHLSALSDKPESGVSKAEAYLWEMKIHEETSCPEESKEALSKAALLLAKAELTMTVRAQKMGAPCLVFPDKAACRCDMSAYHKAKSANRLTMTSPN